MAYFFLIQPILSIERTDKMDMVVLLYLFKIFTRYFKLYCLILIYLLSAWLLMYSSQGVLLIGLCVFTILHLQPMTQNPLKPYVHVLTAILIHVILFLLLVTLTSLLLIGEFLPAVVV